MIEGSEDISSEEMKFIEECIGVYKDERDGIREDILGPIRRKVNKLMEKERVPIQYLRWRTKEPFSLRQKLIRKWDKYKNTIEDKKDVLDIVTDLAGVRILVLYRNDIPIINEKVFDIFGGDIEECTAYYDEERHGDKEWFMDHGFYERIWYVKHGLHPDKHRDIWDDFKKLKIQGKSFEDGYEDNILDFAEKKLKGKPILEKTSRGYSSVHYIIRVKEKRHARYS